jgi:hypothetical protein
LPGYIASASVDAHKKTIAVVWLMSMPAWVVHFLVLSTMAGVAAMLVMSH